MTLEQFFTENPAAALGFSGGTDSAYLLYAALRWGRKIRAYYVKTAFQPVFELADARRLAEQLGAELTILEYNVFAEEQITANPGNRCYYCKAALFGGLCRQARADGFELIIDGTNASDDAADRPGTKALAELAVRSPLRECGLTKSEVRRRSREAGLFTWNKPAYACLATRIPTGRTITAELLQRVEGAENALFGLGFTAFRVRVLGEAAKLQFAGEDLAEAAGRRNELIRAVKPFFTEILLDLEGRTYE